MAASTGINKAIGKRFEVRTWETNETLSSHDNAVRARVACKLAGYTSERQGNYFMPVAYVCDLADSEEPAYVPVFEVW